VEDMSKEGAFDEAVKGNSLLSVGNYEYSVQILNQDY